MIRGTLKLACLLAATLVAAGPLPLAAQAPPPAPAAFDPSDVYFQAWLHVKDAKKLEEKGDFVAALEKLDRARQLFDSIARFHPDWKGTMVTGRLASTNEAIGRVKPLADNQRKPADRAMAELEGPLPKDPNGTVIRPAPGQPLPTPAPRRLDTGTPSRLDPKTARIEDLEKQLQHLNGELARNRASSQQLQQQMAAGNKAENAAQLNTMTRQRNLLDQQLRDAQDQMSRLRADLASRPVQSEFDRLNQRLQNIEREREATAKALQQSRDANLANQQQIEAAARDLAQARQQVSDLERNLKTERNVANEVIRGQQQQLRQLRDVIDSKDRQLADARGKISDLERTLGETRDAFVELREERDNLLRERDHMAALLKLNEAGRVQELIEQNMALAKELRLASERFDRVKKDSDETKDDYVEALRDLAIAKARIINLQKENQAQHSRLAELEQRLEQADSELATNTDPANQEEAAMLRDIIRRQLRIQDRRRKARELLLAQVKRLGLEDDQMDDAMAMLEDDDLRLSPEESRVLNDRKVDGEFVSPFAVSADKRHQAMSHVERERAGFNDAGTRAFTAGRLAAAEECFSLILDVNPGHVPTLQKLGVVRLKRDSPDTAVAAFRDAVALDAENPYARLMLGVSLYKLGNHQEAAPELRHSIAIDPSNAKAHVYLGNTLFRLDRKKDAEEHFKAAITADPTLSEPYFNLAFLCAGDKRREEGRGFYQKAIDNGAIPDLDLEQRLGM